MPAGKLTKDPYFFLFGAVSVILLILLTILNLEDNKKINRVLGTKIQVAVSDNPTVTTWKNFVKNHPTYFDGWWQLYTLTGNTDYLTEALKIKHNYPFTLPLP